jgi:glycosyltransferase involved in cell wall biosynthesis
MSFLIITHVIHKIKDGKVYAYGPYVREMNLWLKHVDRVEVVAPVSDDSPRPIDLPYEKSVKIIRVPAFSLVTPLQTVRTLILLPLILFKTFTAMRKADHIHLRLPGNMGLVGSFLQIFFPRKPKTVKYAGNWDPSAHEPWSYKMQKRIVNNPFLSRNMKVLVYGEWPGASGNIMPFFTASYSRSEIEDIAPRKPDAHPLKIIFAGSLTKGKRPLMSIRTVEELKKLGIKSHLDIYGDGPLREELENYVRQKRLQEQIIFHGNRDAETLKKAFREAAFLVFLSKSEGWPKVVAEAMIWKCLPVTTRVSAVPYMLGEGERGSIVRPDPAEAASEILFYSKNPSIYLQKVNKAYQWAARFTLEKFEEKIKEILESFGK